MPKRASLANAFAGQRPPEGSRKFYHAPGESASTRINTSITCQTGKRFPVRSAARRRQYLESARTRQFPRRADFTQRRFVGQRFVCYQIQRATRLQAA